MAHPLPQRPPRTAGERQREQRAWRQREVVGLVEERLEVGGGARVDCEEGVGKGREEAGQPVLQQGAFSVLVQRKMGTALDKPPHLAAASFKPFADASLPRKPFSATVPSQVFGAKTTSNTPPTMPRSMRSLALPEKPVSPASSTLFRYRLPLPFHGSRCLFTGATAALLPRIKLAAGLAGVHVTLGTNAPTTAKLVLLGSEDALRRSFGVLDQVVYQEEWSSLPPFAQASLASRGWLQFNSKEMEPVETKKPPEGPAILPSSLPRKPLPLPPSRSRLSPPREPRFAHPTVHAAAPSLSDSSLFAPPKAPRSLHHLPSRPSARPQPSLNATKRDAEPVLQKKAKKPSSTDQKGSPTEQGWQPPQPSGLPAAMPSSTSAKGQLGTAQTDTGAVHRFCIPPSAAHLFLPGTPSLSVLEALNQCTVTLSTTPRTQEVQLSVKFEDEGCWSSVVRAVEGMVRSVEPGWKMSEKQEAAGEAEVSVASRKRRRSELAGEAPTNLPAPIPPFPSFPPSHLPPLPGALPTQHLSKPPLSTLQPAYHPTYRPSRLPICAAPPPFRSHRERSPSFPLSSRSSSPPPLPPSLPRSPAPATKHRPFKPVLTASSTEEENAETSSRTWSSSLLSAGISHAHDHEAERRKLEEEKERRRERDRRRERHRKREEERARKEGGRV